MKKLLLIFLFLPGLAFAQAKEYRSASYTSVAATGGWHSSGAAACQADFAYRSEVDSSYTYNFNSYTDSSATAGSCRGTRCAKSNPASCSTDPNQAWSSTQNRATVCVLPQVWNQPTQTCVDPAPPPPPTCTAGRVHEETVSQGTYNQLTGLGSDTSLPACVGGCATRPLSVLKCFASGGNAYCRYVLQDSGATCTDGKLPQSPAGPTTPTNTPTYNPAQGQGCPKGTVNIGTDSTGGSICAGSGTAPEATNPPPSTTKPPVTTNNPDGTTTTTEETVRENRDGSTTTTTRTTTTNADGSTTARESTVTSNTPTGSTGHADPTKEEASDFCKQNPHLTICKNSSVSGACDQTTCEGDAIQCAILRQQRKQYCEDTTDNESTNLGRAVISGSDPKQGEINTLLAGTTVDLSSQSLNQSGFLAGGSCLASRTITVVGKPVVVSFTSVCENITPLRYAILACALIAAYLLVSKSVLQG